MKKRCTDYTAYKSGINYHFYFTENSFDLDGKTIYFLSNREHEGTEICNLFKMDLDSGEMVQLTDDPLGVEVGRITKTPDGEYVAYVTGSQLRLYNTKTGENKLLYEEKIICCCRIFPSAVTSNGSASTEMKMWMHCRTVVLIMPVLKRKCLLQRMDVFLLSVWMEVNFMMYSGIRTG